MIETLKDWNPSGKIKRALVCPSVIVWRFDSLSGCAEAFFVDSGPEQ